jgi:hypothetical protein
LPVLVTYNFQIKDIEERKAAVAYAASKGMGIVSPPVILFSRMLKKQTADLGYSARLKEK